MKIRFMSTLGALAILAIATCTAQATVLEFGNHGSNADLALDYGSNIVAAIADEFDISNGATPDVALAWGPADANVLEFHNSGNWIAPMTGGKLQFDVDASGQSAFPADPTVDFNVAAGVSVLIDSVTIGHARDMHVHTRFDLGDTEPREPAHEQRIDLINLDTNAVEASFTTTTLSLMTRADDSSALGTGAAEVVNINFAGAPGVSYRLLFDDGGDDSLFPSNFDGTIGNHPRAGIDNLTFRQVPEPTTFALLALCGVAGLAKRRRS